MSAFEITMLILGIALGIALVFVLASIRIVNEANFYIVERLGKYYKT
ncbi:UNVERIFIED_CONTAM: hypothetical protein O8I53_05685 [Campylobacter lari]